MALYQGQGGAVFDLDLAEMEKRRPEQAEQHRWQIAMGFLQPVEDEPAEAKPRSRKAAPEADAPAEA